MNYETIQSFLNTPISELVKDEKAIEQAKNTLKKYESFNNLLKDKLDIFKQCEEISSLELLSNLGYYKDADRNFILGYKYGIQSLLNFYNKYQQAKQYLNKEGVY